MGTLLNVLERREFKRLEKVIEDGVRTFLEVGAALKAIQGGKLYRETHKTFEAYVTERFGFERAHAYRMIEAAEIRENLSPIGDKIGLPDNESQCRELAKVPEDKAAEVWEKAVETAKEKGVAPTAKIVAEARKEVLAEESSDAAPDETPDEAQGLEFDEMIARAQEVIKGIIRPINEAMRLLNDVADVVGLEAVVDKQKNVHMSLTNAKGALMLAMPECVCPRCNGAKCVQCGNHGWVNSRLKKELGHG